MAGNEANATAGLGFMVAFGEFFNIVSALNSSPWTAENFGGDPGKERSARRWVVESVAVGGGLGIVGSLLTKTWWPAIGTGVAAVYVYASYDKALRKARANVSTGWDIPAKADPKRAHGWDWRASK